MKPVRALLAISFMGGFAGSGAAANSAVDHHRHRETAGVRGGGETGDSPQDSCGAHARRSRGAAGSGSARRHVVVAVGGHRAQAAQRSRNHRDGSLGYEVCRPYTFAAARPPRPMRPA